MARAAPLNSASGVAGERPTVPDALPVRHLGVGPISASIHSLWTIPPTEGCPLGMENRGFNRLPLLDFAHDSSAGDERCETLLHRFLLR